MRILYSVFRDLDDKKNAATDGWVRSGGSAEEQVPPAEYEYAVEQGVIAPPRKLTPDQVREWLLKERGRLPGDAEIGDAFIFSLTTGGQNFRSILGSFACFQAVSAESFDRWAADPGLLGLEPTEHLYRLTGHQFWRLYRPSVGHHENVVYAAVDFEMFNKHDRAKVNVADADRQLMSDVLDAIRRLPPAAQLGELNKALTGKVPGSKYDRQHALEILGYADVLHPASQPPMADRYCRLSDCPLPSNFYKKEWRYPVCWWTGEDGVNEEAVARWFPGLER